MSALTRLEVAIALLAASTGAVGYSTGVRILDYVAVLAGVASCTLVVARALGSRA